MFERECISLEEARQAMDAVLKEASKTPDQPIAVALVDDRSDLVCCAKMDKAWPLFMNMAINKAHTAETFGAPTGYLNQHWEENKKKGLNYEVSIWGDDKITTIAGGLVFKSPTGAKIGAIGISGYSADEDDEKMAYVGLNAVKL